MKKSTFSNSKAILIPLLSLIVFCVFFLFFSTLPSKRNSFNDFSYFLNQYCPEIKLEYGDSIDKIYSLSNNTSGKNAVSVLPDSFQIYHDTNVQYVTYDPASSNFDWLYLEFDADKGFSYYSFYGLDLNPAELNNVLGAPIVFGSEYYWLTEKLYFFYDTINYQFDVVSLDIILNRDPECIQIIKAGFTPTPTTIANLSIYQSPCRKTFGLFDNLANTVITGPWYKQIGTFDSEGMAPAQSTTGEWGYIDSQGNDVIYCEYKDATTFVGDCASVYLDGYGRGVIDREGNYIISPIYQFIEIFNEHIIAYPGDGTCYVYNHYGDLIISNSADTGLINTSYSTVEFINNRIYAKLYAHTLYDVYDYSGNLLTGAGDLSNVVHVSLPINGVHLLQCEKYVPNYTYEYVMIADENFTIISKEEFTRLSSFNKLGYADGKTSEDQWKILCSDGSTRVVLPQLKLNGDKINYTYANEYMACCDTAWGYHSYSVYYGLVNIATNELTEWGSTEPIDGTNCIIVTDLESGLKGLYDGTSLVYQCKYLNIYYSDGQIYLERVSGIDVYNPM